MDSHGKGVDAPREGGGCINSDRRQHTSPRKYPARSHRLPGATLLSIRVKIHVLYKPYWRRRCNGSVRPDVHVFAGVGGNK